MRPRLPCSLRPTLAALALACSFGLPAVTSAGTPAASDVTVVHVWPEYREASSFTRIAEYFGGKEKSPELIARSQPDDRTGYYFLARFESAAARTAAILALEYIVPGDERARVQFFNVDLPRGSRAVLAGLTGSDWPGKDIAPTAWRLRVLDASGTELAREQSFLWSLPPLPPATTTTAAEPGTPAAPAS